MIQYYLLLLLATILGQTFFAAVVTWLYQRKQPNLSYPKAFKMYVVREVGAFVVVVLFTFMLMFVLSDYINLNVSISELKMKDELSKWEGVQKKFRTYAIGYGVFAQLIALYFYKGGIKAITDFGKDKGVDIQTT